MSQQKRMGQCPIILKLRENGAAFIKLKLNRNGECVWIVQDLVQYQRVLRNEKEGVVGEGTVSFSILADSKNIYEKPKSLKNINVVYPTKEVLVDKNGIRTGWCILKGFPPGNDTYYMDKPENVLEM